MSTILWISDAGTTTGFGKATHEIAERLVADYGHEIHVLAVGWDAADPIETNLLLYRAGAGPTRHPFGYDRVVEMLAKVNPDLVVTLEDVPMLMKRLLENPFDKEQALLRGVPILAYTPIDGYNIPPAWLELGKHVNYLPMSRFGAKALGVIGYAPHGVDEVFHPITPDRPLETTAGTMTSKADCKKAFGIDDDTFVIGRVDTNSGRKDWGSTWKVITQALPRLKEDEIVAAFHTVANAPTSGVDLNALVSKGRGRFMITNSQEWPAADVAAFVNTFDVTLSTSRGEGFGLGLVESLACGVPVIATDCSSITEVVGPGGVLVPGVAHMTNPYGVDQVLADTHAMADVLVDLVEDPVRRVELGELGRQHVQKFSWDVAASQFNTSIAALLSEAAT